MMMGSRLEPRPRAAGLRYGTDTEPGIRRVRAGGGFRYIDPHGRPVRDTATLARIKSLVIPPAWTDVWISPHPKTHLQATGRDARRRKQYRYHPRWRELSHQSKYSRLVPFAYALPKIRRQIGRDLRAPALCKEKVLAAIVQLLEKTLIRVGNEEYRRANGSFGLTTLRDRHVKIRGEAIRFEFRGKSGIKQAVTLNDARLARIVRRCQELPGQELFQYADGDGSRRSITSADVNNYLRQAAGETFSAKDFRTWAGTLLAARELSGRRAGSSERRTKALVVEVIKAVAHDLRNTPAVCRACYIHPAVLEAFGDGTLMTRLSRARRVAGLSVDEAALLALLESQRSWRQQLEAAAAAAGRAKRAA
jgi:DNA topoisomerase I